MNPKHFKHILFVYLLFILSMLVHYHILLNEIINWKDDELFFFLNALANGASSFIGQTEHAPAMVEWYSLQFAIGGNGHFIYHALSLLLHTANAFLLFGLILRFGGSTFLAMGAAFVFALHPVHVESLAMVTNQPTVLSMFFLQLTILVYANYLRNGNRVLFAGAFLLAVCFSLIGNPSLLLIAGILLVHRALQKELTVRDLAPFVFLWIITVVSDMWNKQLFSYSWSLFSDSVMMVRIGFVEQWQRIILPWTSTLLVDTVSEVNRVQDLMSMIYPFFAISVIVGAVHARKQFPALFYGIMVIILSSLPLLTGISRGEWTFSEDGAYIASAGWMIILVWCIEKIKISFHERRYFHKMFMALTGIVVFLLCIQTAVKSSYWENGKVYWEQCLQEKPGSVFALIKKGMYHYFRYEIDPAVRALDTAIAIAPNDYESHYTRGLINLSAMFLPAATIDFTRAIQLNPSSSNAYFGLGSIHSLYSRYDSSVIAYSRAIQYTPTFFEAYTNRATVYGSLGKFTESFADFEQAQRISPGFGQIFGNRGLISLQAGNAQAAADDFARQIALEPNQVSPRIHAGLTAILLSDTTMALLQFSKAQNIDSLRTKLYLSTAFPTFLKSKSEIELGNAILKKAIGYN